ncbi:DNA-binding protein [Candidatus Saccharibacteria bacterium]|nr:DNA-binding protein [Candidatus Saccharibacteria bacterium]
MKVFSLRLLTGQELRQSLVDFAKENNIRAGSIVTCVGALKEVTMRMAGAQPDNQDIRTYKENFEIVSLSGTIEASGGSHLHIALSRADGSVIGGHLKSGTIDITAEVVIIEDENVAYSRELDDTGFECLVIKPL